MQSPPFPRYLVPPRSKYSPQHQFSNTLSFLSSHNVNDQVSHPHHFFVVLCIYIFNPFESIHETFRLIHWLSMHKFVTFGTIVEGIITWQEQFSFLQGVSLCPFSQILASIRQNSVSQNMLQ